MKYRRMNLQYFAGNGLEFLKDILGDQYESFETAIKAHNEKPENKDKQIKLANINSGEYVSKEKYDRVSDDAQNYKTQFETVQSKLDGFKDIDVDKLQEEVERLNGELTTTKTSYEAKIADRDFTDSISKAITAAGGKNSKAIMALLDSDALKSSKNQEADIKAAIENCQKENAYLFGSNEPINNPVGPTGDPIPGQTKKLEEMSYDEYKAYRQGK